MAKRKNRLVLVREPNGRPSRAGKQREFAPTQARRLMDAAMEGMRDAQWGTQLGRLLITGAITAEMYAAGKWWSEMASRYHAALGAPGPFPRAMSLEVGRGNQMPDPDSDAGRLDAERDKRAVASFHEAHAVLMAAGQRAESAVRRLCEDDVSPCGTEDMQMAARGLLWVAEYRGLTNRAKPR